MMTTLQSTGATPRTSYLVAAIGKTKGALVQCFGRDECEASRAVEALFVDTYGEEGKTMCIDTEATVGLVLGGDPDYIRGVIEERLEAAMADAEGRSDEEFFAAVAAKDAFNEKFQ